MGAALPEFWLSGAHQGELGFFLSSWKIWEAAVGKQRITSICHQRLGWEDTQGSLLKESSWGGQEAVCAAFLLSCTRGQAACVHHFHHILHLSYDVLESLAAVVVGRDLAAPRVWGLGWKAPQFLPLLFLVPLPGCCSKRLEDLPGWMKHVRVLYSAIRKDKAKNSKIKLRWSLTTFMFFSFVPNYKTLECDDFIWKQVAPLWQQQPNSKWEFLFHAPDKGLVLFSCQCAEDGPAVCWWYWKQSNCLFKKLSNKETPKWNGFFSPIFCWRIWNLTGHHGGCSVKGLESWSLGRAVTANYLCPGWEVLVHLVLRQV